MTVKATIDTSEWDAGLAKLKGELRDRLAHSMCAAGAKVIKAETEVRTPAGPTGNLAQSIYYDWKEALTSEKQVTYRVSWNTARAPHGHLIEFGHWQPFVTVKINAEDWITTKVRRPAPKWIPAHPFLRPAYEASKGIAYKAMIERGRTRLQELLRGEA